MHYKQKIGFCFEGNFGPNCVSLFDMRSLAAN